jgi:GNAT superfamily N-acetyltransferase
VIVVEVRSLSPDDWRLTRQLRLDALLDAPFAFGGTYEATAQRTEEQWREWPTGGQPFAAFVAGRPVGIACGVPSGDTRIDLLISMWVEQEARGSKAAPALIDAVARWARDRGRDILELDVYESNRPAYRAYLKAGFTVIGPCAEHPGALTMHRDLNPEAHVDRRDAHSAKTGLDHCECHKNQPA